MIASRWKAFAVLVVLLAGAAADGYGQSPERRATDAFVQRLREARTQSRISGAIVRGKDNDAVIDAYMDVIAHYEGEDRRTAMWFLRLTVGIREWKQPTDPRRLGVMLPARVAPILLAALRDGAARYDMMELLGSIDEPSPEVIAAVGGVLRSDDPDAVRDALRGVAMLGVHAAEFAPHLEHMLDSVGPNPNPNSNVVPVRKVNIAGALARVSATTHEKALDVLIDAVRRDDGAERPAVRHLTHLGGRAEPAVGALLELLKREVNEIEAIVEAILVASPDALPSMLAILIGRTVPPSGDEEYDRRDRRSRHSERAARVADLTLAAVASALRSAVTRSDSKVPQEQVTLRLVGPLALVSEDARGRALEALVAIARGEDDLVAARAVKFLGELGSVAAPVTDDLMLILHERNPALPAVANALVSVSPDLQEMILPSLLTLVLSQDAGEAAFAERELMTLVENHNLTWLDSERTREITPALIQAVETRPVSDVKTLASALRRLNTSDSRAAYNAFLRRERTERRRGRGE